MKIEDVLLKEFHGNILKYLRYLRGSGSDARNIVGSARNRRTYNAKDRKAMGNDQEIPTKQNPDLNINPNKILPKSSNNHTGSNIWRRVIPKEWPFGAKSVK